MRKDPLVTGEYYHIYNRGVDKRNIFANKKDLHRFILSVREFNRVEPIGSIKELLESRNNFPDVGRPESEKSLISITCYCFNPNHIHFIVKQEIDGGISEFFKRLLGGYTKYFNRMHNRSGALFQGKFKSNLIKNDQYFLKIRPYVNMNYLVHQIPAKKSHLVWASDREYNSNKFDLVSKKEAKNLLSFYGNNKNFRTECLRTISIIKEERGATSLSEEDILP